MRFVMLYRQHLVTNFSIGCALEGAAIYNNVGTSIVHLSFAISFALATLLLSPDLDLFQSTPNRNWGLLRILWWPYTRFFRHRGWSHIPIVGSLTRLLYIALWICITLASRDAIIGSSILYGQLNDFVGFLQENSELSWTAFGAVVASDISHLFGDWLTS